MKKYVEVFWTPWTYDFQVMQTLFVPPKPILSILSTERNGTIYLKCPALKEVLKNEYVITAPFDLNITFNKDTRDVFIDRFGQKFYDEFFVNRSNDSPPENPFMLSMPPAYMFYSHDDVSIELKDVSLLVSTSTSNLKVIPGGYNISKWIRPVEFAVEVIDATKPIQMCIGDPLFSVKFVTPNNIPVKLTRVERTLELKEKSVACTQIKSFVPNLKLPQLYKMAESYLSLLLKK